MFVVKTYYKDKALGWVEGWEEEFSTKEEALDRLNSLYKKANSLYKTEKVGDSYCVGGKEVIMLSTGDRRKDFLRALPKEELENLLIAYDEYVIEEADSGNAPVCLMEFYENDYQERGLKWNTN